MPFELPSWLNEPAHPFEALAKGAAVGVQLGKAFADNMYRNQALYVRARQEQQEQDLRVRELNQRDSKFSLESEIARTKMAHDTEDYETLKTFIPAAGSALTFDELNRMQLPPLHDAQNYLKLSVMLDRTKTEKAMGEMGAELATTTDWADPAVYGIMLKWAKKAPDITLAPAYDHLLGRHQAAVVATRTAKRLQEETDSRIADREERGELNRLIEERRALLADSTIDLNDSRIAKNARDTAIEERRLLVQEGNLGLRAQELGQKGRRLDARAQASYNNELKALNEEEKAKLKEPTAIADPAESDRLRKLYNMKRRGINERFYGPAATNAPVVREGLKTEDRTTNAPPAVVAPTGKVRVIAPDGRAGLIPESQLEEALKAGYKQP